MNSSDDGNSGYWATEDLSFDDKGQPLEDEAGNRLEASGLAAEVMRRKDEYVAFYQGSGLFERDKRSYLSHYGFSPDGGSVSYRVLNTGTTGGVTKFVPNLYANTINHTVSLVCAQKPNIQISPSNSDSKSIQEAKLGDSVFTHYTRKNDLESKFRRMVEKGYLMREAWAWPRWNSGAGPVSDVDEDGSSLHAGDMEYSFFGPGDVIRDTSALDVDKPDWLIVRYYANRYDLAARFPEYESEVMAVDTKLQDSQRIEFSASADVKSDLIPVYQMYHRAMGKLLPLGRQATVIGNDCCLLDGPLMYGEIPVFPFMPKRMDGTSVGHTPMTDLLALQQILNALYSGMVTNHIAFTIRRILVPRGQPVTAKQLMENLAVIYYDPSAGGGKVDPKPTGLDIPLNTSETKMAIEMIESLFDRISGISDVVRGDVRDSGVKAASGLALVEQMAQQYQSDAIFAYNEAWRSCARITLKIVRKRCTEPVLLAIAGKKNASIMREFKGSELADDYRIDVDIGGALKTLAQRQAAADIFMQNGAMGQGPEAIKNYTQFLQTGSLDETLDSANAETDLIDNENDSLMAGICPTVTKYDTHSRHRMSHTLVAFNSDSRQNPMAMGALNAHLAQHDAMEKQMAAEVDAQAAALMTIQNASAPILPPPGPGGMPPPGPPMPPGGPARPPGPNGGGPAPKPPQDGAQTLPNGHVVNPAKPMKPPGGAPLGP